MLYIVSGALASIFSNNFHNFYCDFSSFFRCNFNFFILFVIYCLIIDYEKVITRLINHLQLNFYCVMVNVSMILLGKGFLTFRGVCWLFFTVGVRCFKTDEYISMSNVLGFLIFEALCLGRSKTLSNVWKEYHKN